MGIDLRSMVAPDEPEVTTEQGINLREEVADPVALDLRDVVDTDAEDTRSLREEFVDSTAGQIIGDIFLTVRNYNRDKTKQAEAKAEQLEPYVGAQVGEAIGYASEASEDALNVGVKAVSSIAQIPTDVASITTSGLAWLMEQEKIARPQNKKLDDWIGTLDRASDTAAGMSKDIDSFTNYLKDNYLGLEETRAEDDVTNFATLMAGGVSLVKPRNITKAKDLLTVIPKEAVEFATGAAAMSGVDTAFEPITADMVGVDKDSPIARRGLNFVEEAIGGVIGDMAIRGSYRGAKQLGEYFTKEPAQSAIDREAVVLSEKILDDMKMLEEGTPLESVERPVLVDDSETILYPQEQLDLLSSTSLVPYRETDTGLPARTDQLVPSEGGSGGKPPSKTGAEFYMGEPDGQLVPYNDNVIIDTRNNLVKYYEENRLIDEASGEALPTVYAQQVDEYGVLHKLERYNRIANGLSSQGQQTDSSFWVAKHISQKAGAWSNHVKGTAATEEGIVRGWGDDGQLYRVGEVKNLKAIVVDAANSGATSSELDDFMTSVNAVSDYFTIDADLANTANSVLNDLVDRFKSTNSKRTNVSTWDDLSTAEFDYNLPPELGKNIGKFFIDIFEAARAQGDEYLTIVKDLEVQANELKAQLRKSKLPKSLYESVSNKLEDMIDQTARQSQMSRDEAEEVLASFAEKPWASQFIQDYSNLNKFVLQQRVSAGELDKSVASTLFNLRPGFVPSYKVVRSASGTTERLYGAMDPKAVNKRRKISPKRDRDPLDTIPEYYDAVGRSIEHARTRRVILDYYLDNFGDNLSPVFKERAADIKEAVAKLEAGDRKKITTQDLNNYSDDIVETRGDVITFPIAGGELELTVKDKDLYNLLARTVENKPTPGAAWKMYRALNELVRVPVTGVYTPVIYVKEGVDSPIMSNANMLERFNILPYVKSLFAKETNPRLYNDLLVNSGLENRAGAMELRPGQQTGESFRNLVAKATKQNTGFTDGLRTIFSAPSKATITDKFHGFLNRFDMAIRVVEYEQMRKQGYSHGEAVAVMKERGVNFTQRGYGVDDKSKSTLVAYLKEQYEAALKSGDREAIKRTKYNLLSVSGKVGMKISPRGLVINNSFVDNLVANTAFARSFVNSSDTILSRAAYNRKKVVGGVAAMTMTMMGAKIAGTEGSTDERVADLYNRSTQSESGFRRNTNVDGVSLSRGFAGQVTSVAEEVALKLSTVAYTALSDNMQLLLEEHMPETVKAMENFDPANNNVQLAALDFVVNQFRFEPPILGTAYRSVAGVTAFDTPIVPEYKEGGPSYLKYNSNTSPSVIKFAEVLQQEFGESVAPAKLEQALNDLTGGAFGITAAITDYTLQYLDVTPEMRRLKTGETLIVGNFLNTEQVTPDEWKVNEAYYRLADTSKSTKAAYDALLKQYEIGAASGQEVEEFYSENYNMLAVHDIVDKNRKSLIDISKDINYIRTDTNDQYTSDPDDRAFFGSQLKTEVIDDYRTERYAVMKDVVEQVKALPDGEYLVDSLSNADSKSLLFLNTVNRVVDAIGTVLEEPVDTPDTTGTPVLEGGIDLFEAMEEAPTIQTSFGVDSQSLLTLADTLDTAPEFILDLNSYVGNVLNIDPALLTAIQRAESGFRNIDNLEGTSSASGYMQLTDGTWKLAVKQFGDVYGVDHTMRGDVTAEVLMAGAVLKDDIIHTVTKLNSRLTPTEVYVLHHFGREDGVALIETNRSARSATKAATTVSKGAVKANPSIFTDSSMSVRDLYKELQRRLYNVGEDS